MKLKELTRGKGLALLENVALLAIIVIMLFMSFGTIFTLSLNVSDEFEEDLNDIVYDLTGEKDVQFNKDIDINFMFLVKTATTIVDIVEAIDGMDNDNSDPTEKLDEEDLQNMVDLVVFAFALVSRFGDIMDIDDIDQLDSKTVINALLFIICVIYLIIFTLILVLTLAFATLGAVFSFLISGKKTGKASARISKSIHRIIKLFPGLLFIRLLTNEIEYGSAITGILWLCVAALGIGFVVSRVKKYDKPAFKYLNVLQIVSAVSVAGLVVFVLNLLKTDILLEAFYQIFTVEFIESIVDGKVDFIPLVFLVILLFSARLALKSIPRVVTRFACMSKSRSAVHIAKAIFALLIVVVPFVMMNYDAVGFTLNDDQYSAFILASVGVVIMLVAEIVLAALSDNLCDDCSEADQMKVVTGAYVYNFAEEETAEAAPEEKAAE